MKVLGKRSAGKPQLLVAISLISASSSMKSKTMQVKIDVNTEIKNSNESEIAENIKKIKHITKQSQHRTEMNSHYKKQLDQHKEKVANAQKDANIILAKASQITDEPDQLVSLAQSGIHFFSPKEPPSPGSSRERTPMRFINNSLSCRRLKTLSQKWKQWQNKWFLVMS